MSWSPETWREDYLSRRRRQERAAQERLREQRLAQEKAQAEADAKRSEEEAERWAEAQRIAEQVRAAMQPPVWRTILSEVAKKHGFRVDDILGIRRNVPLVTARHEAMWRIYWETTYSLPAIGRIFNRDHTTILHGVRKVGLTAEHPSPVRQAQPAWGEP